MNIIIPVAGEGTRLRPHTQTKPKPLLKVAGKAIIGYILDSIRSLNPEKIVLVLGHQGEKIKQFALKNYSDMTFDFVYQKERKGLGDAIFKSTNMLDENDAVLILLGDTIFNVDYKKIIGKHKNFIGIKETSEPERFGIVEIKDKKIVNVIEKPKKPPTNFAIVGLYYFERIKYLKEALKYIIENNIRTGGEYQLTDGLTKMIENGIVLYPFTISDWFDCGKKESLLETQRHLLKKYGREKSIEGSIIIPPVHIEDDASIESSIIGPYVSVGNKVHIKNSIVRDSILYDGSSIENLLIESSIIGENSVVNGYFRKVDIGDFSKIETR